MKVFRIRWALATLILLASPLGAWAQVVTLPMEKVSDLMFIDLKVNGEAATFVFDTGATMPVMDTELAEAMGWEADQATSVQGAGGSSTLQLLSDQEFELGGTVTLPKTQVVLRDLTDLEESIGREFDGIIGYNILVHYLTLLDFETPQMILYDRATSAASISEGYTRVKFNFGRGIPIPQFKVSLTLTNGETVKGPILFDSGAGSSLIVNRPFHRKHQMLDKAEAHSTTRSTSLTTQSPSYNIAADKLSFAGFEVSDLPVRLSGSQQGVTNYDGYLGLLGAEVINRFQVVLDYDNKTLYLKPNVHYQDSFDFPLAGFGLKWKQDGVEVGFVVPDSQAEQEGIVEGMRVLSINGETYAGLEEYRELLKQEGEDVTLVVSDEGKEKTVVIRLKRLI
ncbi:MAG TPA: hypothetical protein DCE41_25335 [Cytophagales bacterium]|nr:hypothetical protein [Cytophagales bacterium]HAA23617.1 hypothetical protein [Cytophagales bacterium]